MKNDEQGPSDSRPISRRSFIKGAGAIAAASGLIRASDADAAKSPPHPEPGVAERLGPDAVTFDLKINDQLRRVSAEPRVTLLRALRDHLNLTGSKLVCDRGACGACTVHLDGRPVTSCMILAADARGHEITTIEGLGTPARMTPLGEAFVWHDGAQCGFCTPGMVMSIASVLRSNPHAQLEEIKQSVAGNICRCGTYPHVFEAALSLARRNHGGGAKGSS